MPSLSQSATRQRLHAHSSRPLGRTQFGHRRAQRVRAQVAQRHGSVFGTSGWGLESGESWRPSSYVRGSWPYC